MNTPSSEGESCKRQENGDVAASDRPLKKARFAWQVKGKYHLRNEVPDNEKPSTSTPHHPETAGSSSDSENDSNDLVKNTEQNLEILGDYLLKQDFNTLDSVITDSDKSLMKPCTNISSGKLSYPKYVASYENGLVSPNSTCSRDNLAIPMSLVQSPSYSEDQCIARWQARQMAKGFVDNTINRVLDSWMIAPLPAEMDTNRFLALDVAEFINNLPGDNSIENEGILMAISAHGLQKTSTSSIKEDCHKRESCSSSSVSNNVYPSPPSSPMSSDDENVNEAANTDKTPDTKDTSKPASSSCLCSESMETLTCLKDNTEQNTFTVPPFSIFPETPGPNREIENLLKTDNCYDEDMSPNDDIFANHFDFMDAAVSFAIQNKGLTSYGTDYG